MTTPTHAPQKSRPTTAKPGQETHGAESFSGYVTEGQDRLRELVRDREATAVLIALAAGFCVGTLLGGSLAAPRRRTSWTDRVTAEGIGQRILDNLGKYIPDTISNRLGG